MKKILAIVLAALLIVAALAGCAAKSETADTSADTSADASTDASADTAASDDSAASGELEVIKVGASSTPHAEILELPNDEHEAEKVVSWLQHSGLTWKEER